MNNGFITTADFADETHPNDYGYKKMASVWWAAFQIAEHNEWLTAPPDVGIPDGPTSLGQLLHSTQGTSVLLSLHASLIFNTMVQRIISALTGKATC